MASAVRKGVASASVFAGVVNRTWIIPAQGRQVKAQLVHNTISGSRELFVASERVPGSDGSTTAVSKPTQIFFDIDGGRGIVRLVPRGGRFEYSLFFNDTLIPEESVRGISRADDDAEHRLTITVEGADIASGSGDSAVVWYRMHNKRNSDGEETVVHRRFSNFVDLFDTVSASYKGTQLYDSLPQPPSRAGWFTDHFSPDFIEQRRMELESFMEKLATFPRIQDNEEFLVFAGLVDRTRETSVIFPPGALYMTIRASREFAEVAGFKRTEAGELGPAEASGRVRPGDAISKVNGENVISLPYESLVARIRAARRPLLLHFLGIVPGDKSAAVNQTTKLAAEPARGPGEEEEEEGDDAPAASGAGAGAAAAAAAGAGGAAGTGKRSGGREVPEEGMFGGGGFGDDDAFGDSDDDADSGFQAPETRDISFG